MLTPRESAFMNQFVTHLWLLSRYKLKELIPIMAKVAELLRYKKVFSEKHFEANMKEEILILRNGVVDDPEEDESTAMLSVDYISRRVTSHIRAMLLSIYTCSAKSTEISLNYFIRLSDILEDIETYSEPYANTILRNLHQDYVDDIAAYINSTKGGTQ